MTYRLSVLLCSRKLRKYVKLRYQYRCYPDKSQEEILAQCFGVSRFVYNWGLDLRSSAYRENKESITYNQSSALMTQFKKQEEFSWLNDVSFDVIQQSLRELQTSFKNFFNKTARYPKFKSKNRSQNTCRFTRNSMWVKGKGKVKLTKIGVLKFKEHRDLPDNPLSCTVIRRPSGKYYVSFVVEVERGELPKTGKSIGIDFGIKDLATLSSGEAIKNPRHLKRSLKKIKRLNHQLSRKIKGSNRRKKAKIKLARAHEKVKNQRLDSAHKLTLDLVKRYDTICIEDLDIRGMKKNHLHAINQSLADVSLGQIITLLKEKANMYGKEVKEIDRYYPSSQTCHKCNYRNQSLKLTYREWTCESCKTTHDRDLNAAKNILAVGHTVFAH